MLHLQSKTSARWLQQVDQYLNEILIDHAHCEQKAASTAMDLMFDYVEDEELCRETMDIVKEELEHFQLVRDLIQKRGVKFRRLKPGSYGRKLKELVSRQDPLRAVDRLLIAALIEARSCEPVLCFFVTICRTRSCVSFTVVSMNRKRVITRRMCGWPGTLRMML